jgi:chorismate dehydratase
LESEGSIVAEGLRITKRRLLQDKRDFLGNFAGFEGIEGFDGKQHTTRPQERCYTISVVPGKKHVSRLRISIVEYLNTAPLVRGFTHGPLREKYELSFTVPSQCAEALRAGAVDLAIIPAIEYQRIPGLVVLPNLAIASKKSVRSLLLISSKPIQEVRKIALDKSSRSTQALTRILCRKRWGIEPEFFEAEPDLQSMLRSADAALLIGDPALRLAFRMENRGVSETTGELLFSGASAGFTDGATLFAYDIVEKWRSLTSLPAVLAVWAARRGTVTAELVRDFQSSAAYGKQRVDEISVEAAAAMELPADKLRRYLTENIDYSLDEDNLRGLRRYYDFAAELGLISSMRPLEIAEQADGLEHAAELASARRR